MKLENYLWRREPQVAGTSKLSGRGPGGTCNWGSCQHGVRRRDVNRVHGTYNQPLSQDWNRYACRHCRAIRKALAHYKTE